MPEPFVSGGRAENERTLRRGKGRECPSFRRSRGRAENSRALKRDKGQERPNLSWAEAKPRMPELWNGVKAENARTFRERIRKPRTPVLSEGSKLRSREHPCSSWFADKIRIAVAENIRAGSWIGSGPDCSVPGRFILAARLRSGGRGGCRTLGAGRARCGRGTRCIYKLKN